MHFFVENKGGKAMDKRTAICDYLKSYCVGKENAVFSSKLEKLFCTNGRAIRKYVNSLRRDGYLICSDEKGYYYAETQMEVDATVKRLHSQMINMSGAKKGMLYASANMKFEDVREEKFDDN